MLYFRFSKLIFIGSAFLPATSVWAQTQKLDFNQSTGSTEFHAIGRPSAIKINGTGASPKGAVLISQDGKISGELLLDLSTLDTGISMRTNHMKEKYLEVGKYPQARLAITDVLLPKQDLTKVDYSENAVPFKGMLFLHGASKPVEGLAHIERHGQSSMIKAEFSVKITDFQIPVPVFAGITVANDVSLVVTANAPFALLQQ
ncbi:MAG: YceI family protein [Oligoflexia bacterium]|nr:YceI family protein [Oligoflexia bacterium]